MSDDIIGTTPDIWGEGYSTDSATVERDYEAFAGTGSYDETFEEWGYVGPETAAAIVRNYVPLGSRILDAACGSGLTGAALARLGYTRITGIDITQGLLDVAEGTGAYERLERVDMQAFPLPFDDDEFDAVEFIGALTYFETSEILRELCRIVRPGGLVLVDNAFAFGELFSESPSDPETPAIRAFNDLIAGTPGLHPILVPFGDGLWVAVRE